MTHDHARNGSELFEELADRLEQAVAEMGIGEE
jgi:hypothetical protein